MQHVTGEAKYSSMMSQLAQQSSVNIHTKMRISLSFKKSGETACMLYFMLYLIIR